jgi:hypothetical protein
MKQHRIVLPRERSVALDIAGFGGPCGQKVSMLRMTLFAPWKKQWATTQTGGAGSKALLT